MEYTHLGRSGLTVSRLCLGTMNFGMETEEADSFAHHGRRARARHQLLRHREPLRRQDGHGGTEAILGRWFAQGGGRREQHRARHQALRRDGRRGRTTRKLSALNIRRALDASLQRLQTDYIDLYQFHHIDRDTPWDEIWQAMEVAVAQGKILYAGSSNFAGWHIATGAGGGRGARNFTGLVSEQSLYNLLVRDIELEVIPAAQANGLGVIPWSPLHGGLLGGVAAQGARGQPAHRRARGRDARRAPRADRAVRGLRRGARRTSRATWRSPGCCTSPPSPRRSSARAPPSSSTRPSARSTCSWTRMRSRRLDEIFPGHKTAPEDYAW